jgi:hypothetical protein
MPLVQGQWPKNRWSNTMQGQDQNGAFTNNVHMYRGRPYCLDSAIQMERLDYMREVAKVSRQNGLRAVGMALMTGRIAPATP